MAPDSLLRQRGRAAEIRVVALQPAHRLGLPLEVEVRGVLARSVHLRDGHRRHDAAREAERRLDFVVQVGDLERAVEGLLLRGQRLLDDGVQLFAHAEGQEISFLLNSLLLISCNALWLWLSSEWNLTGRG